MILPGSAKLLVASGSPAFLESERVQMRAGAVAAIAGESEKSSGASDRLEPVVNCEKITASPMAKASR